MYAFAALVVLSSPITHTGFFLKVPDTNSCKQIKVTAFITKKKKNKNKIKKKILPYCHGKKKKSENISLVVLNGI